MFLAVAETYILCIIRNRSALNVKTTANNKVKHIFHHGLSTGTFA
jgi:hypothetical protein